MPFLNDWFHDLWLLGFAFWAIDCWKIKDRETAPKKKDRRCGTLSATTRRRKTTPCPFATRISSRTTHHAHRASKDWPAVLFSVITAWYMKLSVASQTLRVRLVWLSREMIISDDSSRAKRATGANELQGSRDEAFHDEVVSRPNEQREPFVWVCDSAIKPNS